MCQLLAAPTEPGVCLWCLWDVAPLHWQQGRGKGFAALACRSAREEQDCCLGTGLLQNPRSCMLVFSQPCSHEGSDQYQVAAFDLALSPLDAGSCLSHTVALFWERCTSMDAWLCSLLSAFHQNFHFFSGPHFLTLPGSLGEGQSLSSPPSNSLLPAMLVFHFLSCIPQSDPRKAGKRAKLPFWLEEVYSVMPLVQGACLALEEPSDGSYSQI